MKGIHEEADAGHQPYATGYRGNGARNLFGFHKINVANELSIDPIDAHIQYGCPRAYHGSLDK
jgi:hypothetical protein